MVVFQFANDIRAGKKVCYTLSRCPHRLAAKDATLSRWISRVRIPLGAPQHLSRSRRVFRLGLFSFRRMCAKPVRQMCAKPAENRPSDSPRGNGENPHQHGERPRRGPFSCPVRPLGYRFACPFTWALARPSATPRRAPLPVRSAAPRPIGADRSDRVQITPSERRTAPRNGPPLGARYSIYALGPAPAVKLAPQRVGGGIRDICHQPPRIPRINVARQLRNG